MTGDFLFGLTCGVGACVVLVLLGALAGRFIGRQDVAPDHRDEPCSDL